MKQMTSQVTLNLHWQFANRSYNWQVSAWTGHSDDFACDLRSIICVKWNPASPPFSFFWILRAVHRCSPQIHIIYSSCFFLNPVAHGNKETNGRFLWDPCPVAGVRTASRAGCAWLAWTLANGIWILGEHLGRMSWSNAWLGLSNWSNRVEYHWTWMIGYLDFKLVVGRRDEDNVEDNGNAMYACI